MPIPNEDDNIPGASAEFKVIQHKKSINIGIESKNALDYFIKGGDYNAVEDYERAILCFQKAIEIDANEILYYEALADNYV
jgi:tetratricopeptide (TPR) repeat protein